MTKSRLDSYLLPVAAITDLITKPAGTLRPLLTPEEHAVPFTALDCFDQSLRRSNLWLMQADGHLILVGKDSLATSPLPRQQAGFVTDLPDGPLKTALAKTSPRRRLLPGAAGELQQAALALVDDQEKTVCRVHLMYLATPEGRHAALAMLQAVKGYDASLHLLRERILALGATAFDSHALHEQLSPGQATYDAKPNIPITGDATAFDAANHIISAFIPLVRANEHGIITDLDTEFLHDYRVQCRKIRSVLSLFSGVYGPSQTTDLKTRFAAIMAATGRLRDLDVYLLERHTSYGLVPGSLHKGLDTLYRMFAEQRKREQAKLARHLEGKPYTREIAALAALFAQPENLQQGPAALLQAHDYAYTLIRKRYRNVCKIAAGIGPRTPDDKVHALRIQCKKLRYLMEFFAPVFPAETFKTLLKPLKRLQDSLGAFNDYSVQQESLQAAMLALPKHGGAPDLNVAQSVGALVAVLHARQRQARARVERCLTQFNSPSTQQLFNELLQEQKV